MKAKWVFDTRKIPDEVMNYLRRIAVRAVEEKHYSPEVVADFLDISRSSIYDWLREYREKGESALDHPITHKLALSIAGIGSFSGGDAQGEHLNPL